MKKLVISALILVLSITTFVGCGSSDSKVVGTWKTEIGTEVNFTADGSFERTGNSGTLEKAGTYTFEGTKLTVKRDELPEANVYEVAFNNDDTMTLTQTAPIELPAEKYTRKK